MLTSRCYYQGRGLILLIDTDCPMFHLLLLYFKHSNPRCHHVFLPSWSSMIHTDSVGNVDLVLCIVCICVVLLSVKQIWILECHNVKCKVIESVPKRIFTTFKLVRERSEILKLFIHEEEELYYRSHNLEVDDWETGKGSLLSRAPANQLLRKSMCGAN